MEFYKRDDPYVSKIVCLEVGISAKNNQIVIAVGEVMLDETPRVSIFMPDRLRWFTLEHVPGVI